MGSFKKVVAVFNPFRYKNLTDKDIEFLRTHLNKQEQVLFYRMLFFDQRHSLDVAYDVQVMGKHKQKPHQQKMIRSALLHDVGKMFFDWSVFSRIYAHILFRFIPALASFLAEFGKHSNRPRFFRALYNKKYHCVLAEGLLKELNVDDDEISLIKHHHDVDNANESIEVIILKDADRRN